MPALLSGQARQVDDTRDTAGRQPIPEHSSIWINAEDTARLTGIHPSTVVRLIKTGELPGRRVGRQYFTLRSFIENLA